MAKLTSIVSLESSMFPAPPHLRLTEVRAPTATEFRHIFDSHVIRHAAPARHIYRLPQASVDPQTGVVFSDKRVIQESSSWPPERVNAQYLLKTLKPGKSLSDPAGFIVLPSSSYYHWLIEDLPSFITAVQMFPNARIITSIKAQKYVRDLVELLGLSVIEVNNLVKLSEVIFVGKNGISGVPQLEDLVALKSHLGSRALADKRFSGNEFVYVTRRTSSRSPSWERFLEAELEASGFKVLDFNRMSLPEQIQAMANAKVLVGIHGAGLTNAAFLPPGGLLIEIMDTKYPNNCFEILAMQARLNYGRVLFNQSDTDCAAILDAIKKEIARFN